jgi:hypothetical protein
MAGIAHRDERDLDDVAGPSPGLALCAFEPFLGDKRDFPHQAATRAVMPLGKPEEWDCEVTVCWRIVPADSAVIRGQEEVFNVKPRGQPPFIDLELALVDILSISRLALEPVVEPAANDRDSIRQDHHGTGAERRDELASP